MKKIILGLSILMVLVKSLQAQTTNISILTPKAISNIVDKVVTSSDGSVTISTNTNTFILDLHTSSGSGNNIQISGGTNIVVVTNALGGGVTNWVISQSNLVTVNTNLYVLITNGVATNITLKNVLVTNGIYVTNSTNEIGPDNGSSILQLDDHVRLQFGNITNRNQGSLFMNSGHGGFGDGSEFQWDFGLMSFNIAPGGHVQMNRVAGGALTSWYNARNGFPSSGTPSVDSHLFGWEFGYYNGAFNGGFEMMQLRAVGTNGLSRFDIRDPVNSVSPSSVDTNGLNRVTLWSGVGAQINGNIIREKSITTTSAGATYNINLASAVQEVFPTTSLVLGITNVAILTSSNQVLCNLYFFPGIGAPSLSFSAVAASINLLWDTPDGLGIVPTNIPSSKVLHLEIAGSITQNQTNCIIKPSLAPYASSIDPAAATFFAATGTVSSTESNAINSFVVAAKTHGYWNNLLAFYPFIGATSNICSYNLVDPTKYRIAWVGSSSTNFTAQGVYGDGSTFVANTGFIPSTQLSSLSSGQAGVWLRSPILPADTKYFYGVTGTTPAGNNRWGMYRSSTFISATGMDYNALGGAISSGGGDFTGFMSQNRTTTTSEQAYFKGIVAGGIDTTTAVAHPDLSVFLFARNSNGSTDGFSDANLSGGEFAQNMTLQNITDLVADWLSLNNVLGR